MDVFDIIINKMEPDVFTEEVLLLKIEEVAQAIKTYCNRSDIPDDLMFVHANMTLDLIHQEIKSMNPADFAVAKSVKEVMLQLNLLAIRQQVSKQLQEYSRTIPPS